MKKIELTDEFFAEALVAVFFFLLIAVFIVVFIILYQKRHNKYIQEKQTLKTNFQKEILQTQIEIQEQTLKTISQEIHDNIGQALSLVKLNLSSLPVMEQGLVKLTNSKDLVGKVINDLRDLSRSMHGDKIAETGLPTAIENELRIIQNTGQFKTDLEITGSPYKFEPQKEMILFRIVQEAIHNAIKHSKAENINVNLDYQPGNFKLSVQDDGKGFNIAALDALQTGIGLKNMQSRAGLIGGLLSIQSSQNTGTVVLVKLEQTVK